MAEWIVVVSVKGWREMEIKTLWLADSRRHKGSLAGIFVLVFLVSVSLVSVMAVWRNAGQYVRSEMKRLGYGTITVWISGISEIDTLTDEMNELLGVKETSVQPIIFSEYEVNGQESDSEGQLVTYEPDRYAYKIFSDDMGRHEMEAARISPGEIYVSPSLNSMFGVEIGDEISFLIARNGGRKTFTVKGWFEDPFKGSSMIGMKSFLISGEDHDEIARIIAGAGIDALARDGYMVHIFAEPSEELSATQLNALLNSNTGLLQYTEFTHSEDAIYGFMMTLQNVFTGLLMAFVLILIFVSLVVMGHSISSSQEQDMADTGILKTIGFTTKKLQKIQMLLYLAPVSLGMASGIIGAFPVVSAVSRMTMTTTGLLIPAGIPFTVCFPALFLVFGILAGFVWLKTAQIEQVTPMKAIRGIDRNSSRGKTVHSPIYQKGLCFWLAFRQVISGKKRYLGACLVAVLLVFFTSLIGRMDSWLGSDGKGLMDAFNPADLHIAAQPMGKATSEDVERTVEEYTNITDQYMLAMPSVSVEGADYTANVITQPERFHMLQGQTCMEALDAAYGGDVYLHENSWPGLYGILSAMELLMYFMYGIVVIMVLVITALTGSKLLVMEQKDMGIYRSFGVSAMRLRISFALRFGMVSFAGALIGIVCSAFLTDSLVAALLRMYGISNFSSHPDVGNVLLPALVVIGAFTVFAWLVAGRIKTDKLVLLLSR